MTLPDSLPAAVAHAFAGDAGDALPLHVVRRDTLAAWRQQQDAGTLAWLDASGFDASPGSALLLPGAAGAPAGAVLGVGDPLDPYAYAHAPFALPARAWRVAGDPAPAERDALALGWGLGAYRFDRYKTPPRKPATLAGGIDPATADVLAACLLARDLVNTPTQDMGPDELEQAVRALGAAHGAEVEAITGPALLERNFPAIHAVGRASHRAPRLLVLRWGDAKAPQLTLVGKGVCFDTGGLDLKAADGMRWMKKDMGGAAHAIALAGLVMARALPVRLTLLVPAVENAIGPDAFRPGEVLATRSGASVEVDNTDAEGRLVLCDALTFAGEQRPDLLVDFATLTGAARVALGPDLPALYANDDALAGEWLDAGMAVRDPVWRLPLWRPYLRYLTSGIADIANSGPSKMGGSITAALFLERFVPANQKWAHLDVYAWNDADRPGRPAGGEAQGLRAAWAMLAGRFARS
ncbi:leucyl aminopeptidase family protein [Luteimonas pelagia]